LQFQFQITLTVSGFTIKVRKHPGFVPHIPFYTPSMILLLTALVGIVSGFPLSSYDTGGVAFFNSCNSTIFSFTTTSVGIVYANSIETHSWHWEPYQYPVDGSGVSIKLSRSNSSDNSVPITQLEYSFTGQTLWYDLSNVNCGPTSQTSRGECPFLDGGMFLEVGQEGCPTSACNSEDLQCPQASNLPSDNWAVRSCDYNNKNLLMFFCSSVELS
jgi:hypothetical protein